MQLNDKCNTSALFLVDFPYYYFIDLVSNVTQR